MAHPQPRTGHGKPVAPTTSSEVRRGRGGYRRHPNGILDLTPITQGRFDLVSDNARISPLLRLPGEVRNLIWELALGGNTICPNLYIRSTADDHPPPHRFNLLLVSRQMYAETAAMPICLSIWRFLNIKDLYQWFERTTLTYDMIRNIEVDHEEGFEYLMIGEWQYILKKFPELKGVSIIITSPNRWMVWPQNMDMDARVEQGQKTFDAMKNALGDGLKEKVTCKFVFPK